MASSTTSAGLAGDLGNDPVPKSQSSSSSTAPVELKELSLDAWTKSLDIGSSTGTSTSGLLNNILIPQSSLTSDFPSFESPSNFTPSALPLQPTTNTSIAIAMKEMDDHEPPTTTSNAELVHEGSTSQERLTAPEITQIESSSRSIDAAPAETITMTKSEGKAPAISNPSPPSSPSARPSRPRVDSEAIGPPIETSTSNSTAPSTSSSAPVLNIILLLTTGARHPYKIDERYLTKRSVTIPGVTEQGQQDPYTISVYTLKELILREWRDEWETKPSSPSGIRLIYFGRLLDDKSVLKECKFKPDTSNVVHMTIRPQEVVDEEDAERAKSSRGRDDGERSASCRCVIV